LHDNSLKREILDKRERPVKGRVARDINSILKRDKITYGKGKGITGVGIAKLFTLEGRGIYQEEKILKVALHLRKLDG